ncbi:MAG TPA: hypothetical protein H9845_02755 [Candidatus Agathobaculum pullicola]|nr:hypothetical protein [Candidatus Agathobaculum pullicola]
MSEIKLLALDLDGTLLDSSSRVTQENARGTSGTTGGGAGCAVYRA